MFEHLLAVHKSPAPIDSAKVEDTGEPDNQVQRFQKKPVVISAIRWTGDNLREVITFTDGKTPCVRTMHAGMMWEQYCDLVACDGLKIYTLEGKMIANVGDWIIRGVQGEFYPCKHDIFEQTYAAATLSTQAVGEHIDIVFDQVAVDGAPPEYSFIEVENSQRASIKFGEWVHRDDGYWVLRIATPSLISDQAAGALIPMLLFCPKCLAQHIDAPEKHPRAWSPGSSHADYWKNPPHKSHLCHACGNIWRPADVATTGVANIKTKGKADTWDSTAPTTGSAPEINQCDGCRVNAPLTERYGNHAMPDGGFMACTKDRYAAPASPAASVPVAVSGPCLIVKGTGETDLPVVHIVHSLEEARHAVLSLMYSDPADAEDTETLFAEFDDELTDSNYWSIAFEIGGISVERVCLDVALLAASMGGEPK